MRFDGLKRRTNRNRPVYSPRQRHQTEAHVATVLAQRLRRIRRIERKNDKMSEQPTIEEVYKRPEYFDTVWSESIECYGVTKQSIVCMEECAELIEAYDDRKHDGLTDGTRSHMVEEMADVLICLGLLEHMYDIKGRDNRTRHPSPVGACAALIKAVSKILRYGTEKERLDGLADAVEDVRRWVMRLEKRKRHHGRGTRRMGGTQNSQTTAAK